MTVSCLLTSSPYQLKMCIHSQMRVQWKKTNPPHADGKSAEISGALQQISVAAISRVAQHLYVLSCTSAGNAAVVKPSEVCVHTAKVMEELLPLYIDKVRMGLITFT